MADEVYLTEAEAAEVLCVRRNCLCQWRHKRTGPPYLKLGRTVRYRRSDLDRWAAAQRVDPAAEELVDDVELVFAPKKRAWS